MRQASHKKYEVAAQTPPFQGGVWTATDVLSLANLNDFNSLKVMRQSAQKLFYFKM